MPTPSHFVVPCDHVRTKKALLSVPLTGGYVWVGCESCLVDVTIRGQKRLEAAAEERLISVALEERDGD